MNIKILPHHETDIEISIIHRENNLLTALTGNKYTKGGDKIEIKDGLCLSYINTMTNMGEETSITDSFMLEGKITPKTTSNILAYWLSTALAEKYIIGIEIEGHIIGKRDPVGSSNFSMTEFKDISTLQTFIETIKKDFNIEGNDIKSLNVLLENPKFVDTWHKNIDKKTVNKITGIFLIKHMIKTTKDINAKTFSELSEVEKSRIMLLNRLLLSKTYPRKYPINIKIDRNQLYEMLEEVIQEKYQLLKNDASAKEDKNEKITNDINYTFEIFKEFNEKNKSEFQQNINNFAVKDWQILGDVLGWFATIGAGQQVIGIIDIYKQTTKNPAEIFENSILNAYKEAIAVELSITMKVLKSTLADINKTLSKKITPEQSDSLYNGIMYHMNKICFDNINKFNELCRIKSNTYEPRPNTIDKTKYQKFIKARILYYENFELNLNPSLDKNDLVFEGGKIITNSLFRHSSFPGIFFEQITKSLQTQGIKNLIIKFFK